MKKKQQENLHTGIVTNISRDLFIVDIGNKQVKCKLSGKIRQAQVRIVLGDRVDVVVDDISAELGRIIYRHNK